MNIEAFKISTSRPADELMQLLNSESIHIAKVMVAPHENTEDSIYVVFEEQKEALEREKQELDELKPIAQEIRQDAIFTQLKNARQRTLYLLDKFNLPKSTAEKLIEVAKLMELIEANGGE